MDCFSKLSQTNVLKLHVNPFPGHVLQPKGTITHQAGTEFQDILTSNAFLTKSNFGRCFGRCFISPKEEF